MIVGTVIDSARQFWRLVDGGRSISRTQGRHRPSSGPVLLFVLWSVRGHCKWDTWFEPVPGTKSSIDTTNSSSTTV